MYRFLLLCLLLLVYSGTRAQKTTRIFATHQDTLQLKMDIYQPQIQTNATKPCVIFVFGGGFVFGKRDAKLYRAYFDSLNQKGFVVASIDYRLGLRNSRMPTLLNRKPLIQAIDMAVEDLYSATDYLVKHAAEFQIDTGKIVVSGSSAGGITALQGVYEQQKGAENASMLPAGFRYAGAIAFAGAVYSKKGRRIFQDPNTPLLMFHGNRDDLVPYNKISLLGTGIYGPKSFVRHLRKNHIPYFLYTYQNRNHEISTVPMTENFVQIRQFLEEFILEGQPIYKEVTEKNDSIPYKKWSLKALYNRTES